MSTLYQVHTIRDIPIYHDSYLDGCFICPEAILSLDIETYELIRKWCLENHKVLSLLGMYTHSGCKFSRNFCDENDARKIIESPIVEEAIKEKARQFLKGDSISQEQFPKRKRQKQGGYVYVLQSDNGLFKIGRAKDLDSRIKQMTPKLPYDLKVVIAIETDDMVSLERDLHKTFVKKRKRGEWFELNEDDLDFIRRKTRRATKAQIGEDGVSLKTIKGESYRELARKKWRKAVWIDADEFGPGPFALLAHCRHLTISLHKTIESAKEIKALIDKGGCGGDCTNDHEIIDLRKLS